MDVMPRSSAEMLACASRTAVPPEWGGDGRSLQALVSSTAMLTRQSLELGIRSASQRLLVEVLLNSENGGLREYRLPSLLDAHISGNCTALWPRPDAVMIAAARDTGRGWLIDGDTQAVPNLGRDWFLATVAVQFEGEKTYSIVLLRSDEEGVNRRDAPLPGLEAIGRAALGLRHVFFREDEIVASDGPALVRRLAPIAASLRSAVLAGACLAVLDTWPDGSERSRAEMAIQDLLQDASGPDAPTALTGLQRRVGDILARPSELSTPVAELRRAVLVQLEHI